MIPRTLSVADLREGQAVPVLERTLTLVHLVAYAGATWDWHRLHYDPDFAAFRGLPRPVVDGQMLGALLAEALLDWLGPRAFIRRLSFRLRGMVFAGDTVRCDGEVAALGTGAAGDVVTVAQQIRVGERLAVEPASAEVLLPR